MSGYHHHRHLGVICGADG
jgi:predicted transposase YbfD/YdcC